MWRHGTLNCRDIELEDTCVLGFAKLSSRDLTLGSSDRIPLGCQSIKKGMGTNVDEADEDLEKLLEFDNLDSLFALDSSKQGKSLRLPSNSDDVQDITDANGLYHSQPSQREEAKEETGTVDNGNGSVAKTPTSPRQSPGLGRSSGPSHHVSRGQTTSLLPVGKDGGGHSDQWSSRNLERPAEDGDTVIANLANHQTSTRSPPLAAVHNVEAYDGHCGQDGVTMVPNAARNKRPVDVTHQNSQGTDKRLRPEARVEAERTQKNDLSRQRRDGTEDAGPIEHSEQIRLASTQLLPSRQPYEAKEPAEDHFSGLGLSQHEQHTELERDTSPPPVVLPYRIPGPAGTLQSHFSLRGSKSRSHTANGENFLSCEKGSLAADALDFREGPWLAAMELLGMGEFNSGENRTIGTIRATKRHIHQLVAVIKTATPNGFGDLAVILQDPTGTVNGCIHRRVLTELEDGPLITAGAVIILKKVAIFSPTPHSHYLNITINNVDRIFGKDATALKRKGKAVSQHLRNNNPSTSARHHSTVQGSTELPQTRISEPESFNVSNLGRKGATELNHYQDKSDQVTVAQVVNRPLKPAVESSSVAKVQVAAVNLVVPTSAPNDEILGSKRLLQAQYEAKASQDAIAKAAGWDLNEDVELLLDDDFPFLH